MRLSDSLSTGEAVVRVREAITLYNTRQNLRDVFKTFDMDGDGFVSLVEFAAVFKRLELQASSDLVRRVFEVFDRNGDGKLAYYEFVGAMSDQKYTERPSTAEQKAVSETHARPIALKDSMSTDDLLLKVAMAFTSNPLEDLEKIFLRLDLNHDNSLDVKEFYDALSSLGFTFSRRVLLRLFKCFDADHNRRISLSEFKELLGAQLPSEQEVSRSRSAPAPHHANQPLSSVTTTANQQNQQRQSQTMDPDVLTHEAEVRDALNKIVAAINARDYGGRLHSLFKQFDLNHDGYLSFEELRQALQTLDCNFNDSTLQKIVSVFDNDGSNSIYFYEFVSALSEPSKDFHYHNVPGIHRIRDEIYIRSEAKAIDALRTIRQAIIDFGYGAHLHDIFVHLDTDNSGFLDVNEFGDAMRRCNIHISQDALEKIFDTFDLTHTGQMRYYQFLMTIQTKPDVPNIALNTPDYKGYQTHQDQQKNKAKRSKNPSRRAQSETKKAWKAPSNESAQLSSSLFNGAGNKPKSAAQLASTNSLLIDQLRQELKQSIPAMCQICAQWFTPRLNHPNACTYHPGKMVTGRRSGIYRMTCCNHTFVESEPTIAGCQTCPHKAGILPGDCLTRTRGGFNFVFPYTGGGMLAEAGITP